MTKDVAQLLVVAASNPSSKEVLSPTNLVLERPARLAPHALNVTLLLIATQPGKRFVAVISISTCIYKDATLMLAR